jgi:hypothetical protein
MGSLLFSSSLCLNTGSCVSEPDSSRDRRIDRISLFRSNRHLPHFGLRAQSHSSSLFRSFYSEVAVLHRGPIRPTGWMTPQPESQGDHGALHRTFGPCDCLPPHHDTRFTDPRIAMDFKAVLKKHSCPISYDSLDSSDVALDGSDKFSHLSTIYCDQ